MARRGTQGEGSVYRRKSDGRWVATVFAGYHPGSGTRVRRTFYGDTEREAVDKRKEFLRDLEDGNAAAEEPRRRGMTVGEWLDRWLLTIKAGREPNTYMQYEVAVRLHIKPYIGAVRMRELEVRHLEEWQRALREAGVGTRSQQVALTRLRTAFRIAVERKRETGLKANVATQVELPRSARRIVRPPSTADARKLLEAARSHRLEALVTVALAIGLRRGEVLGLRWEDVDLEARTMVVRQRVQRVSGDIEVRQGRKMHPDAAPSTLALPQIIVQALRAHRGRQLEERLRAGTRWKGPEPTIDGKPAGYVFTSLVGTILEPRNIDRAFATIRARAGIDDKTFHELRHDCASLLLAEGIPMYAVSQILRHASPAITAKYYAHLTPELQREAMAEMDRVLGPLTVG